MMVPAVARLALPVVGDLVALLGEVLVEAALGDVERGVDEPLGERGVRPVEHLAPLLPPLDPLGLLGPERVDVLRLLVDRLVTVGLGGELRRRRELAVLTGQRIDGRVLGHWFFPLAVGGASKNCRPRGYSHPGAPLTRDPRSVR